MKKLIITFVNMKVLPIFLSMFNVSFWIFFRGGKTLFEEYPMTQIIKQEKFQLCAQRRAINQTGENPV